MCGRAAQTLRAINAAACSLKIAPLDDLATKAETSSTSASAGSSSSYEWRDNYNMSPGMDAFVIYKDDNKFCVRRKVWGLVTRGGTANAPLESNMSMHFSNLMFNARSDTLFQKPTFARLANSGKSCLIALDGFFEWKAVTSKGRKQPYFVYRNTKTDSEHPYLLMAGLWTGVPTGRGKEQLDTFTIITTEACKSLEWLHDRMPVFIWDDQLAQQWLDHPTLQLHRCLDEAARNTPEGKLDWHAVTPDMSSAKFRSADAIQPLPTLKTVLSFFKPVGKESKISKPTETSPVAVKSAAFIRQMSPPKEDPSTLKRPASNKSSAPIASEPHPSQKKPIGEKSNALFASQSTITNSATKKRPVALISTPNKKPKQSPQKKGSIESFFAPKRSS